MPSSTTNYGLTLYDKVADTSSIFQDFRDNLCGTGTSSNMNKIDTALKTNADSITALKGTGYVSSETVHGNATNITSLQGQTFYYLTATASSSNVYTATSSAITAYSTDLRIILSVSASNTGSATLNINSLGAKTLAKVDSTGAIVSLGSGDLQLNKQYTFRYNGSVFIAINLGTADQINVIDTAGYYTSSPKNEESVFAEIGSKLTDFSNFKVDSNNITPSIIKSAIRHNAWPLITKAANGDLLCIYNNGTYHGIDDVTRGVYYKRSTDKGYTWGAETLILNDQYDDATFCVGTTSTGAIIVIIRRSEENISGVDVSVDNVVFRSTDNGNTWTNLGAITALAGITVTAISPIVEIPTKGLMASWHSGTNCSIIWSTDDGVTWGSSQDIVVDTDYNNIPMEVRFAYVGSGKIFGIGRNQVTGGGAMFQLQSSDYGVTWTVKHTNITDQYWTPSGLIYKDNKLDLTYYDRENGILRRRVANLSDIWDKPTYWADSVPMLISSASDCGYPMSANINDDLCIVVFYAGISTKSGIYGVRYSFNDFYKNYEDKVSNNITYYVRTDGSDNNDGSADDSSHAFKTIQKAIDKIPKHIPYGYSVIINVAAGTYAEDIIIADIYGSGVFQLLGDTTVSTSRTISSLDVRTCTSNNFIIRGFNATSTTKNGFQFAQCNVVSASYLNCDSTSASFSGVRAISSNIAVLSSAFYNRANGIACLYGTIYSENNSGTGNTNGLSATYAGTIGKSGTQPSGTTAEYTTGGGVIR